MNNNNVQEAEITKRLRALFESLMNDSDAVPLAFKPVARNLVNGYLQKSNPQEVEHIIIRIRDEVIPWLLHHDNDTQE